MLQEALIEGKESGVSEKSFDEIRDDSRAEKKEKPSKNNCLAAISVNFSQYALQRTMQIE